MEIVVGFLDVTDWVDLYAFASPWNDFFNFALATGGAAIPVQVDYKTDGDPSVASLFWDDWQK